MESIREDTIGGFNAFLKQQQEVPGKATLTLVQFDSQDPYEIIHHFKPLTEVTPLTTEMYVPRASTPLLDAMGRGINDLQSGIAAMPAKKRPSRVVMVVITDGQENASHEFTKQQVEKLIKQMQEINKWQFVFLSADLTAINEAMATGMKHASSLAFDKTSKGTRSAWHSASHQMACLRTMPCSEIEFTVEDRAQQENEKKR